MANDLFFILTIKLRIFATILSLKEPPVGSILHYKFLTSDQLLIPLGSINGGQGRQQHAAAGQIEFIKMMMTHEGAELAIVGKFDKTMVRLQMGSPSRCKGGRPRAVQAATPGLSSRTSDSPGAGVLGSLCDSRRWP